MKTTIYRYGLLLLVVIAYITARVTSPTATNLSEFNSLSIMYLVLIQIFDSTSKPKIK